MTKGHIEIQNGKRVWVSDRGDIPGSRKELLRGTFAVIEYTGEGKAQVRLVLLSFNPLNRKLVFDVEGWQGDELLVSAAQPLKLWLAQDSPGMAKDDNYGGPRT